MDSRKPDIDDIIEDWHNSKYNVYLWQYLGWTREEYARWVQTGEQPEGKEW